MKRILMAVWADILNLAHHFVTGTKTPDDHKNPPKREVNASKVAV
jgi:hypothetical protein